VYQSTSDPTWTSDIVNWVVQARAAASADGLKVIVNHTGDPSESDEQTVIQNSDVDLNEAGFSDYGEYATGTSPSLFTYTYNYTEWLQSQGKGAIIVDRYAETNEAEPTSDQLEYAIATYLMVNEGSADLYVSAENAAGTGYGTEQYHPEYATAIGKPCAPMYGGASYDPNNPSIYYRRFGGGMAIVNPGSTSPEHATLPSNHVYADIENRPITNQLTVNPDDAYVLTTTNGCT
jgi:hypothetical protein